MSIMLAANIMIADLARLSPSHTALDALRLCRGQGAAALPVVDDEGRMIGIVGVAALMKAVFAAHDPDGAAGFAKCLDVLAHKKVGAIMETDFLHLPPDAPASRVASLLERSGPRAGAVFVLDNGARLLGVITPSAFLNRLSAYAEDAG